MILREHLSSGMSESGWGVLRGPAVVKMAYVEDVLGDGRMIGEAA